MGPHPDSPPKRPPTPLAAFPEPESDRDAEPEPELVLEPLQRGEADGRQPDQTHGIGQEGTGEAERQELVPEQAEGTGRPEQGEGEQPQKGQREQLLAPPRAERPAWLTDDLDESWVEQSAMSAHTDQTTSRSRQPAIKVREGLEASTGVGPRAGTESFQSALQTPTSMLEVDRDGSAHKQEEEWAARGSPRDRGPDHAQPAAGANRKAPHLHPHRGGAVTDSELQAGPSSISFRVPSLGRNARSVSPVDARSPSPSTSRVGPGSADSSGAKGTFILHASVSDAPSPSRPWATPGPPGTPWKKGGKGAMGILGGDMFTPLKLQTMFRTPTPPEKPRPGPTSQKGEKSQLGSTEEVRKPDEEVHESSIRVPQGVFTFTSPRPTQGVPGVTPSPGRQLTSTTPLQPPPSNIHGASLGAAPTPAPAPATPGGPHLPLRLFRFSYDAATRDRLERLVNEVSPDPHADQFGERERKRLRLDALAPRGPSFPATSDAEKNSADLAKAGMGAWGSARPSERSSGSAPSPLWKGVEPAKNHGLGLGLETLSGNKAKDGRRDYLGEARTLMDRIRAERIGSEEYSLAVSRSGSGDTSRSLSGSGEREGGAGEGVATEDSMHSVKNRTNASSFRHSRRNDSVRARLRSSRSVVGTTSVDPIDPLRLSTRREPATVTATSVSSSSRSALDPSMRSHARRVASQVAIVANESPRKLLRRYSAAKQVEQEIEEEERRERELEEEQEALRAAEAEAEVEVEGDGQLDSSDEGRRDAWEKHRAALVKAGFGSRSGERVAEDGAATANAEAGANNSHSHAPGPQIIAVSARDSSSAIHSDDWHISNSPRNDLAPIDAGQTRSWGASASSGSRNGALRRSAGLPAPRARQYPLPLPIPGTPAGRRQSAESLAPVALHPTSTAATTQNETRNRYLQPPDTPRATVSAPGSPSKSRIFATTPVRLAALGAGRAASADDLDTRFAAAAAAPATPMTRVRGTSSTGASASATASASASAGARMMHIAPDELPLSEYESLGGGRMTFDRTLMRWVKACGNPRSPAVGAQGKGSARARGAADTENNASGGIAGPIAHALTAYATHHPPRAVVEPIAEVSSETLGTYATGPAEAEASVNVGGDGRSERQAGDVEQRRPILERDEGEGEQPGQMSDTSDPFRDIESFGQSSMTIAPGHVGPSTSTSAAVVAGTTSNNASPAHSQTHSHSQVRIQANTLGQVKTALPRTGSGLRNEVLLDSVGGDTTRPSDATIETFPAPAVQDAPPTTETETPLAGTSATPTAKDVGAHSNPRSILKSGASPLPTRDTPNGGSDSMLSAPASKEEGARHTPQRTYTRLSELQQPRSISFTDGKTTGQIDGVGRGRGRGEDVGEESEDNVVGPDGERGQGEVSVSVSVSARTRKVERALQELAALSLDDGDGEAGEAVEHSADDGARAQIQARSPWSFHSRRRPRSTGTSGASAAVGAEESRRDMTYLTECSFGVAKDRIIEVLTDVAPWEPDWEHMRELDVAYRGLESCVKLKEFMPRLEEVKM